MTRREELERLRDAVKAGKADKAMFDATWPHARDFEHHHSLQASLGDMNAALTFVEATLLTYSITLTQDPSGCGCRIVWWPNGLSGVGEIDTGTVCGPSLAVTCLVACLTALIAQEGQE